ncbi:MAG: hypothetical protein PHX44_01400 [Sulfurimonas sp.]|uniref:hypothetical protein n=1 Tax=Sulfurimonas sp. TaxID=2022749 RepID=UPI0026162BBF|nr:hypothetical protein [Sulfurimonas sp.]MDD2651689.1 hypothetical protein [Sulfurimonas sp.]MDD3451500.1 hypothetical protein [Sulfurimonas sp.]
MDNQLVVLNSNTKIALSKARALLNTTNKILATKNNDEWFEALLEWAELYLIQEKTYFPANKKDLLETKSLSLRWNRLKTIPEELCNLKQLEMLELNNNVIEYLPQNIDILKNLQELNLNINSLKNLPKEIVKLKNLKVLNIEPLANSIPTK